MYIIKGKIPKEEFRYLLSFFSRLLKRAISDKDMVDYRTTPYEIHIWDENKEFLIKAGDISQTYIESSPHLNLIVKTLLLYCEDSFGLQVESNEEWSDAQALYSSL